MSAGLYINLSAAMLLALMTGCTAGYDELKQDVKRLEKGLADLRSFQAEQTSEVSTLQTELRRLSGRVEELEYLQRARLGSDISTLKQNISNLQRRVPPPAIVPAAVLDDDDAMAQRMSRPEVAKALGEALAKIREGSFADALPLLEEAYAKNYGEQGTVEIVFWEAVAFEGLGENRKALEAYGQLVTAFPENPRKKLALLRQAAVFVRMGDKHTAELTLRKLIGDYPKSSEAQQAQERLKSLR